MVMHPPTMPVDLPQFCSVVSHELRTPVSVLQGYIRLLQKDRPDTHPDAPILAAMLDAVSRVAALSRQASDLGRWLHHVRDRAEGASVSVVGLTGKLANAGSTHTVIAAPDADVERKVAHGADHPVVIGAFVALADAVARDVGNTTSILTFRAGGNATHCVVEITSVPSPTFAKHRHAAQLIGEPAWFASGGLGLALVSAACVFDVLGATITSTASNDGITVHLPLERGDA